MNAVAVKFEAEKGRVYLACDTSWTRAHALGWMRRAIEKNCYHVKLVRVEIRELAPKPRKKR